MYWRGAAGGRCCSGWELGEVGSGGQNREIRCLGLRACLILPPQPGIHASRDLRAGDEGLPAARCASVSWEDF